MSRAAANAMLPSDDATCDRTVALEAAFDRCATSLYRYFVVRLGDADQADDFMQQLWVYAPNLGPTPPAEVEFRLRAIAKNLVRTHWRRVGSRPASVPLVDAEVAGELARRLVTEELPEDVLSSREARDHLLLALTELSADEQHLIVRYYFHGRSHVELARELDVSPRAIEGRLYRARVALRDRLTALEPF